jgi:hypothetical protein
MFLGPSLITVSPSSAMVEPQCKYNYNTGAVICAVCTGLEANNIPSRTGQ